MKGVSTLIAALLLATALNTLLSADILNFDDINASLRDVPLDGLSPYQGLNRANATAYTSVPGFPGFNNGIVFLTSAAYTAADAFGSSIISAITRASGFAFTSAYIGSGRHDGLSVTLNGMGKQLARVQSNGHSEYAGAAALQLHFHWYHGAGYFINHDRIDPPPSLMAAALPVAARSRLMVST
jgi:hypothetical protein